MIINDGINVDCIEYLSSKYSDNNVTNKTVFLTLKETFYVDLSNLWDRAKKFG